MFASGINSACGWKGATSKCPSMIDQYLNFATKRLRKDGLGCGPSQTQSLILMICGQKCSVASKKLRIHKMEDTMNRTMIALSLLGVVCWFAAPAEGDATSGGLDTKAIDQAIGKPGELKDDVYKVSLPRKDLSVSL